jgi:hypothetical protein
MGLEELLRSLELVLSENHEKLLTYIAVNDKLFLYKKNGYITWYFRSEWNLVETFQ